MRVTQIEEEPENKIGEEGREASASTRKRASTSLSEKATKRMQVAEALPPNIFPARPRGPSSVEVAREKAAERWETELQNKHPEVYARALESLTPAMADAATEVEVKRPGAGYLAVLETLREMEAA